MIQNKEICMGSTSERLHGLQGDRNGMSFSELLYELKVHQHHATAAVGIQDIHAGSRQLASCHRPRHREAIQVSVHALEDAVDTAHLSTTSYSSIPHTSASRV